MATSEKIILKKCGCRFSPPAIVITYQKGDSDKIRRRTMPLRNFNKNSGISRVADDLRKTSRHEKFISLMTSAQLEKLIAMIRDRLNGVSVEEIVQKAKAMEHLDPDEDLNKVDQRTLNMKKAMMEKSFEKNRKVPGDPGFKYDVEVDFNMGSVETCEWDSDSNDFEDGF